MSTGRCLKYSKLKKSVKFKSEKEKMKIKIPKFKKPIPERTPIDERVPKIAISETAAEIFGNLQAKSLSVLCPYCGSLNVVKRGVRKKKFENAQLFLCRNAECGRSFTAADSKGRRYPMKIVIEGLNYYNLGLSLEQTCRILKQKLKAAPDPQTLSKWVEQYKPLCRYERLRSYALKMYSPMQMIECVTLAHKQLYNFRYHRGKTRLLLEEFKNRNFKPLKEFLDAIASETPHQNFLEGERMSEIRSKFDKTDMIVRSKQNFANRLTEFALKGARNNKDRHEAVQRFMIANDSCTVATEVPVIIRKEDIEHMQRALGFQIVDENVGVTFRKNSAREKSTKRGATSAIGLPKFLTGHIDLLQIRNGAVHILDYKPNAAKEKPIEQLTWYALALSRLTGLRVFEFKCAWFDEKDYFEFFPLHIVKKTKGIKRRKIKFRDGTKAEIPRDDIFKVV